MTDRKLLELAQGSRWADSGKVVIDAYGDSVTIATYARAGTQLEIEGEDSDASCGAKDAIALLHRAGLLDELLAEAWEAGTDALINRVESYGGSFDMASRGIDEMNPYRKTGE